MPRSPKLKTTPINLVPGMLVDDLGRIKAEIADLEKQEGKIREQLIATGLEVVDGELFRCSVIRSNVERVDYKNVIEQLPPSAHLTRLLRTNTSTSERTTVKVTARR